LITETLKLTARTLGPNVNVRTTLASDLDTVRADRSQMSQVLMNLLLNARDAVSGNGEIWVSTANVTVNAAMRNRLQIAAADRSVRISVEDNGCGIPPDVAQRMFEPFFSTKKQGQAYGLGLSVVYGIVRSHGGGIHVESEVGKGTRIHVYLPAVETGAPAETPGRAQNGRAGKSETVLVVDDEKLLRAMLQDILETSGYRVLEAGTGEEALEIYNNHKDEIGVIILDIIMPGMGGARALERLKQINPDLRCIVSSGYGVETLDDGLLNGKHIRFVGKPYKSSSVVSTVREMLEN
jgi:CheY-like chemotaxis protein